MKRLESIKLVQFLLYESEEFLVEETTGIFGPNGSGKSTALDAVQIAMFGANKNHMAFQRSSRLLRRQDVSLAALLLPRAIRRRDRRMRASQLHDLHHLDLEKHRDERTDHNRYLH